MTSIVTLGGGGEGETQLGGGGGGGGNCAYQGFIEKLLREGGTK